MNGAVCSTSLDSPLVAGAACSVVTPWEITIAMLVWLKSLFEAATTVAPVALRNLEGPVLLSSLDAVTDGTVLLSLPAPMAIVGKPTNIVSKMLELLTFSAMVVENFGVTVANISGVELKP